ncbi:MAG: translation elongation factor Ts, partial [Dongiaceae bacterium]
SAGLVKQLREMSGAGMMDCKKALTETSGDLEGAVDWLRKKGLAAAAKKAGRVAAEGLVGAVVDGGDAALVELNSETDFVARNEEFQGFLRAAAPLGLKVDNVDALKASKMGDGRTVEEALTQLIAKIGENMTLRRLERLSVEGGVIASYVHNAIAPGLGKIGVVVALKSSGDKNKLAETARQIAMHVAATNPQSVSVADLDPALVARERSVLIEQAKTSGKSQEIAEKMVEGRLRKYYEDVVLLEQVYVVDGESRVKKVVEDLAKTVGAPVEVAGFRRLVLGEGVPRDAEGDA